MTFSNQKGLPDWLSSLLTGLTSLAAVAVAVTVVRREFWPSQVGGYAASEAGTHTLNDWEQLVSSGHRIGGPDAEVTILEFGDYQCPACQLFHHSLAGLMEQFPGKVALVYRHLPLEDIHPVAYTAAKAAICAEHQGSFGGLHNLLYQQQRLLGRKSLLEMAMEAGVRDSMAFAECLHSDHRLPQIDADIQLARDLSLRGTPSVAINGTLYPSPPDSLTLHRIVAGIIGK